MNWKSNEENVSLRKLCDELYQKLLMSEVK